MKDEYIEKFLKEKELSLTETLDTQKAYKEAEYIIVAAPINVYSTNRIDVASSKRTCFVHSTQCDVVA